METMAPREKKGEPRLARSGSKRQVTAQAPAGQRDAIAVDLLALDDRVDCRAEDHLPIGAPQSVGGQNEAVRRYATADLVRSDRACGQLGTQYCTVRDYDDPNVGDAKGQ